MSDAIEQLKAMQASAKGSAISQLKAMQQAAKGNASAPVTRRSPEEIKAEQEQVSNEMALAQTPGYLKAAGKFVQGLPFVGEYADEALNMIKPGAGDDLRRVNDAMGEAAPKTSAALQITGGIAGTVPMAMGAATQVLKAPGLLGKTAAAVGTGAVAGAVEGGVSGYGSGSTRKDRRDKARERAVVGGGVGAVAGAAAPIIGKSAKEIYRRVTKLDVGVIAREFGISKDAAKVVKSALATDDFATVQARLAAAGDDAMMADANLATGQLLDASSATGGKALQITRDAVDGRANAAGKKLNSTFDAILGKPQGVKTSARAISSRTSAVRKAAYDKAYEAPIDYASDAGRAIEDVMARVPPKALKAAVDEANEIMLEAGLKNKQILAEIGEDGSVVFSQLPDVRQLDALKKGLDEVARGNTDTFGRLNGSGIRYQRLARDIKNAATRAVPEYGRAVKLGGDKIAEDTALDMGRSILSKAVKKEDVADIMRGASDDVRTAVMQGLRENLDDTLANVKRTISDPNVDAREAMQVVKDLSSRANRDKLRLALGSSKTKKLLKELDTATAALELRAMVATNSKTAVRQAVQGQVDDVTAPGLIGQAAQGEVIGSGKQLVKALTGATDDIAVERQQQIFTEIATALTQIKGPRAQQAMRLVEKAMNGQPLKDGQAQMVARVLGGGSAALAYPAGTQALSQP